MNKTPTRLAELQAVANGERGRYYFTKGEWLNRLGGRVSSSQSRALSELRKAGLIQTVRKSYNGPINAATTAAGRALLAEWTA